MCGWLRQRGYWVLAATLAVAAVIAPHRSHAVVVGIEYYDRGFVNPDFTGGPLWTGYVDTTSDTLTIETWQELPEHGSEFWMPRNLPLVWHAYGPSVLGQPWTPYDVPDSFNGNIDDTFAFISSLSLRQMAWEAPVFDYTPPPPAPPLFVGVVEAVFTLNTIEIRPGWGGWAIGLPGADENHEFTVQTANPNTAAGQPLFDERMMPALPVQFPNLTPPLPLGPVEGTAFTSSTEATIEASFPSTVPIPEARQWLALAVVGLAAAVLAWRRRTTRERSASPA